MCVREQEREQVFIFSIHYVLFVRTQRISWGVFTSIFHPSVAHSVIPTCFKTSTIIPVPKKTSPACLNDYHPIALTSVVMKCFERLIKDFICPAH